MSDWTYINGVIIVEAKKGNELRKLVNSLSSTITGSERNCELHVAHLDRVTGSHSYTRNQKVLSKVDRDSYSITLNGCLRDRVFKETVEEYEEFFKKIKESSCVDWVDDYVVHVMGDLGTDSVKVFSSFQEELEWAKREDVMDFNERKEVDYE